ncbi:MAG: BrnA antitoxin family protein [Burkholderiaceae bacterium]
MKEKTTSKQPNEGLSESRTDWKRLREMRDEDIDCGDIAELGAAFWENAVVVDRQEKERISARFDADILEFFRRQGKDYQTRMNAVLRSYMEAQKSKDGSNP